MKPYQALVGMLLVTGGLVGLFACKAKRTASSQLESVVYNGRLWPDSSAIPVCIVNANEVDGGLIADVRNHVTQDYGQRAGIFFVGWSDCQPSDYKSQMIRVYFERVYDWSLSVATSAGGGLSVVGPSAQGCSECAGGTMLIKIGSQGRYPNAGGRLSEFIKVQTRATAVHEFGHALGLLHEHERSDGPGCQDYPRTEVPSSTKGIQFIGAYDPDSIMNYCSRSELNTLSSGDIAGLTHLYPSAGARRGNRQSEEPRVSDSSSSDLTDACRPTLVQTPIFDRTEYSGGRVEVSFRNRCQDSLEVIWLDGKGLAHSYGVMRPGGAKAMLTYEGHSWQFVNTATQKRVREFRIAGWMQGVEVP